MSKFLEKLKPADLIAVVVLIIGLILKLSGADGLVGTLMASVVVYYFGDRTILAPFIRNVEEKKEVAPVEQIIRDEAKKEGVDPDLAVRVAKCESGLDPMAVHVNKNGSKDRGVFQWNDKYHPEVNDHYAFDPKLATREFCKAFKNGNLSWWNATKDCWDKKNITAK